MPFAVSSRPQAKADFIYELTDDGLLIIIDQNLGGVTVTNDVEAVLADIARAENRPLAGLRVTYRDSEGDWCRVLLSPQGRYEQICGFGVRVTDEAEAIRRLRELAA